ncbi:hypothetical protein M433DRAFT_169437, partial [Acidomyces richmondensis BFW]
PSHVHFLALHSILAPANCRPSFPPRSSNRSDQGVPNEIYCEDSYTFHRTPFACSWQISSGIPVSDLGLLSLLDATARL